MAAFPQSPGRITQIFLTYLKTLGDIYLALNAARLLSDNLSLSRAPVARRRRRPASVAKTAFLFGNIDLHVSAEQCLHGNFFTKTESERGGKEARCDVVWIRMSS